MTERTFGGKQFRVTLRERGVGDKHVEVVIESEDDDNWYEKMVFSSHWLPELIECLLDASEHAQAQEPAIHNGQQYGWRFK